jgi:hypothetical protein
MNPNEFLTHLRGVKRSGRGFVALCPAHEDRNPSLSVTEGEDGRILLKCHAGCSAEAVVAALGLTVKDLFGDVPRLPRYHETGYTSAATPAQKLPSPPAPVSDPPPPRRVVAVYDYGFAKKVRYEPKSFAWFRPRSGWTVAAESSLPPHEQEWLAGRGSHEKSLYAPKGIQNYTLIVEGEKDADNLSRLELYAVSPEDGAGAGKWAEAYTRALVSHGVTHAFICPDNDPVGDAFGREIASALGAAGITAVTLPLTAVWGDAPLHADWSDYLAAFGEERTVRELCDLMSREAAASAETIPEEAASGERAVALCAGVKFASEFGEDTTTFLWKPYLPVGEYTVMMADGGTGKTMLACALAAYLSTGRPLPGQDTCYPPVRTLLLSAEDKGEILRARLRAAGADLSRVAIIDCTAAAGYDLTDRLGLLSEAIGAVGAGLLVVDPWHAFVGADTNINQINTLRPILSGIATMAKERGCAVILISHVNKKAQGENANNAAAGSVDFINAARSALRVAFETTAKSPYRLMVHTKSNYAAYGDTVRYAIELSEGEGVPTVRFDGFSEVTRDTLEAAARKGTTPAALAREEEPWREELCRAVTTLAEEAETLPLRLSYAEMTERFGEGIFGGRQPKRALDGVKEELEERGVRVETGVCVRKDKKIAKGVTISVAIPE